MSIFIYVHTFACVIYNGFVHIYWESQDDCVQKENDLLDCFRSSVTGFLWKLDFWWCIPSGSLEHLPLRPCFATPMSSISILCLWRRVRWRWNQSHIQVVAMSGTLLQTQSSFMVCTCSNWMPQCACVSVSIDRVRSVQSRWKRSFV